MPEKSLEARWSAARKAVSEPTAAVSHHSHAACLNVARDGRSVEITNSKKGRRLLGRTAFWRRSRPLFGTQASNSSVRFSSYKTLFRDAYIWSRLRGGPGF